nr:MAG TPA: hypothetical protein [Caudoviricetes sp.]
MKNIQYNLLQEDKRSRWWRVIILHRWEVMRVCY